MDTAKIMNLGIVAVVALVMLGGGMIWSAAISKFWRVGGAISIFIAAIVLFGKRIFPKITE